MHLSMACMMWLVNGSEGCYDKAMKRKNWIRYVKIAIENLNTKEFIPRLDIDSYKYVCSNIEKISKKLESISSNKEIVIKNYKKIIEFVDIFKENVKDYEITRKSKMKYLENKMVLERYKENAEKCIWQNGK